MESDSAVIERVLGLSVPLLEYIKDVESMKRIIILIEESERVATKSFKRTSVSI